ncbi:ABC transporter permease [Wenzhouxiangella sp. AB-CW3]|uniref:ABC transporter permease n=1 Tax=Wenzhouxiangella sp. AB-CW3 TaxID=2771012 RepID=UPI00168B9FCD|nr:ABC transporter permease [Wenzhouxiangella sp. AB-CW3]QOC23156.1 ABC transporter permease [Wenzhouxiangella sp. AB-CW3]
MNASTFPRFNLRGVRALYLFEMGRFKRTLWQSMATPVITTVLYFVVFGSAIGNRIGEIDGVSYGAFIVPGLILLTVFTQSLSNAAFGIYMPRFSGTIYEILSAPISAIEMVLAYVGAAATKSLLLGLLILATASVLIDLEVAYPVLMLLYLFLVCFAFCLAGFIIGIWAEGFEHLQLLPMLVVTPLTFLGGVFYSIEMLPEPWRTISLFNPLVYVISGFRWCFHGSGDVAPWVSLAVLLGFCTLCIGLVWWMLRTGYRIKP